jgi:BON domain
MFLAPAAVIAYSRLHCRSGSAAINASRRRGHSRRSRSYSVSLVLLFAAAASTNAFASEPLKNYYNDPFLQVTNGIANCPQPKGSLMTLTEANAEAHPRAERGTTCFMAGKCKEPNAYRYDAQIAAAAKLAVERALVKTPLLATSSVWITVQRRFVFVQGCVANKAHAARFERLAKSLPDVEYVGADFVVGNAAKLRRVPYAVKPQN